MRNVRDIAVIAMVQPQIDLSSFLLTGFTGREGHSLHPRFS